MPVHLDLPFDLVAQLTELVRENGLSLGAYLLETIGGKQNAIERDGAGGRRAREAAGAGIRSLRNGVVLGPDRSVCELIEEGRRV